MSSSDKSFDSNPKLMTITEMTIKTEANSPKIILKWNPEAIREPTSAGAIMPPILPNPAAYPEPSARINVGYNSGV